MLLLQNEQYKRIKRNFQENIKFAPGSKIYNFQIQVNMRQLSVEKQEAFIFALLKSIDLYYLSNPAMIHQQLVIERAFGTHHLMPDQQQPQQSKTYHFGPIIYNTRTDLQVKMKKRLRTKADLELIDQNKSTGLVVSYMKARFSRKKGNIAVYDIQSSLSNQSSYQNLAKEKKKTKVGGMRKIKKKITKAKSGSVKQMDRSTNQTSQFKQSIFQNEKQNQYSSPLKAIQVFEQIIQGSIGYTTYIFNSPIIQGSYYIEFKVLHPAVSSEYNNPSDLRIGVCLASHKYDTPLGFAESVGFSLNKKKIIAGRKAYELQNKDPLSSIEFKPGDIIGVQLNFSPPYRNPDKQKIWEDSSIIYSLNGKQIGSFKHLMQTLYYPAVSMYNGAQIEVIEKEEKMYYQPKNSIAYGRINQYKNIYI